MDVRVRVIGGFEVEGLDAPRLGSRKARTLLKMLALERGRAVTAETLAERLWPDVAPANPTEQVRVLVSRLRGVLGAERLPRTDAGYALLAEWLDLDALAELVADARRRIASGAPGSARAACTAALELVRGPLLPDEPDAEWAEADRALLARLELDARRSGAEAALDAGDHAGAALLAQGALDHDPFDEVLVRILMRGLVGSGRPASALAAYAALRERLVEELGVSPTPETEELHTAILLAPPDEADLRPAGATPGASLPGRRDVLAALDAALAGAAAGRGSLVLVEGEAGMGKTRLLEVWCAATRAGGATVLAGGCEELTRSLPLQPVLAALDDHLAVLDRDEVAAALGLEAEVLAPFLGRSAERAGPALPVALRDRGDAQLLMFTALLAVLRRLPPPVVLTLDDVHLAGSATVEWLHLVTRRARESPLLVVATQRPEEASALVPATRVVLGPLDTEAAAEVVG
ncbi:MAG TPA: BTAD domain-containing putative transcriptional regulator, partial [Acidimicrobiales bacterium]